MSIIIKPPKLPRSTGNGNGSRSKDRDGESKLFSAIRESLYVAAVSDVLDGLGLTKQAMHHRIRPLDAQNCVIVGRAKTFRWMETDYVIDNDPYGLEIDAMDSLKPGDVAVHSSDASFTNAP